MTPEQKKQIDDMSQYDLAHFWRFGEVGHPFFCENEVVDYFLKSLRKKGGILPGLSKELGYDK